MSKYKLRHDLKLDLGHVVLYRIERLSNGEIGGWIEKESNLSQDGDAWVSGNAWVSGDARVKKDYQIVNFIIPGMFSITVTPQNIAIGCELKTHEDWLKITKKQAKAMGLEEYYSHYKQLVKTGIALVKTEGK